MFDRVVPEAAYEPRLSESGRIHWVERRGDETVLHEKEPGTTFAQRMLVRVLSLLPIESLL